MVVSTEIFKKVIHPLFTAKRPQTEAGLRRFGRVNPTCEQLLGEQFPRKISAFFWPGCLRKCEPIRLTSGAVLEPESAGNLRSRRPAAARRPDIWRTRAKKARRDSRTGGKSAAPLSLAWRRRASADARRRLTAGGVRRRLATRDSESRSEFAGATGRRRTGPVPANGRGESRTWRR